jgi:hypothetical protein
VVSWHPERQMKNSSYRLFSFTFVVLLVLTSIGIHSHIVMADDGKTIEMDAALCTGVRLLDIEGETYGLKAVPVLGIAVFPRLKLRETLCLSLELSLSYTFRSDYDGFYYYDSFGSIGFLPELGFIFPGKDDVDYAIYIGAGLFHSFSEYDTGSFPALAVRTGVELNRSFFSGIYLSYIHSFHEGYRSYETFKLYGSTGLFRASKRGRSR